MKCKYNIDEICVNADCPYMADYCPCYEEDEICKYREDPIYQDDAEVEYQQLKKTIKNKKERRGIIWFYLELECLWE